MFHVIRKALSDLNVKRCDPRHLSLAILVTRPTSVVDGVNNREQARGLTFQPRGIKLKVGSLHFSAAGAHQ